MTFYENPEGIPADLPKNYASNVWPLKKRKEFATYWLEKLKNNQLTKTDKTDNTDNIDQPYVEIDDIESNTPTITLHNHKSDNSADNTTTTIVFTLDKQHQEINQLQQSEKSPTGGDEVAPQTYHRISHYTITDDKLAEAFPTFASHPKHLDNFGWPIYVCRRFAAWYHQKNELTPTDQPQNNDAYITVDRTNPDSPVITIHHYHKLHNNIFKKQHKNLNDKKWKQDLQRTYDKTVGYSIPTKIAFKSNPKKKKIVYLGDKANQSYSTWEQPVPPEQNYYQLQRKHRWKNRFGQITALLSWIALTALLFTLFPAFSIKPAIDIGLKIFTVFAAGITLSWLGIEVIPDTLEWIETRWNKNRASVPDSNNDDIQLTVSELNSYEPTSGDKKNKSWIKTHLPLLYYLAIADKQSRTQYRQWAKKNWPTLLLKGIIWGTVIGLSILSIVFALSAPPTALVPLATFFASHYHMTLSAFFASIAALVGSLYYTCRHYLTSDSEGFQKGAYVAETTYEPPITTNQGTQLQDAIPKPEGNIEEINKTLGQRQTTTPPKAQISTIDQGTQLQDAIPKPEGNIEEINKILGQRQTTTPPKALTGTQSLSADSIKQFSDNTHRFFTEAETVAKKTIEAVIKESLQVAKEAGQDPACPTKR